MAPPATAATAAMAYPMRLLSVWSYPTPAPELMALLTPAEPDAPAELAVNATEFVPALAGAYWMFAAEGRAVLDGP